MILRKSFPRMADPYQRPDTGASYRQSLRELRVMLIVWGAAFVWIIGYCSTNAYSAADEEPIKLVLGFPAWVFYGWVIPLIVANAITLWFCLFFMQDEPMEELPEDTP